MESNSNTHCQAIDSCILLRFILKDIPEQTQLVRELFVNGYNYYVDDVAIMEVVYVLTKQGYSRDVIAYDIQELLRNPMIIYDEALFAPVFKTYLEHPSLSFDDCVLAARADAKGYLPLWTFDRKFAKQSQVARLLTY